MNHKHFIITDVHERAIQDRLLFGNVSSETEMNLLFANHLLAQLLPYPSNYFVDSQSKRKPRRCPCGSRTCSLPVQFGSTFLGRLECMSLAHEYRIVGNFRWVLIFAISRTVYGVAKIQTAIIYSNRNSKVGSFKIAKIKIAKIISHTITFKSRKFSSAKISRYTVF